MRTRGTLQLEKTPDARAALERRIGSPDDTFSLARSARHTRQPCRTRSPDSGARVQPQASKVFIARRQGLKTLRALERRTARTEDSSNGEQFKWRTARIENSPNGEQLESFLLLPCNAHAVNYYEGAECMPFISLEQLCLMGSVPPHQPNTQATQWCVCTRARNHLYLSSCRMDKCCTLHMVRIEP